MTHCMKIGAEISMSQCIETQRNSVRDGRITDAECAICKPGIKIRQALNNLIDKKEGNKMSVPKDRQCKIEGCEKFGATTVAHAVITAFLRDAPEAQA